MGKYQKFDEVPVWQESARLYQRVLDLLEEPNVPLSATFRNQLERAGLCVSSCVAEGFDVNASGLLPLLQTARGAAAQIQSMVAVISDRPKVARLRESLLQIRGLAESCARQLGAWKYAVENPGPRRQPAEGHNPPPAGGNRPQGSGVSPGPSRAGR